VHHAERVGQADAAFTDCHRLDSSAFALCSLRQASS
jgi:hypothetical protein